MYGNGSNDSTIIMEQAEWNESDYVADQIPLPVPTSLRMNPIYISVYVTWMYLVFMYLLPFGGLSVLNLLIYLDVRKVLGGYSMY